MKLSLIQLSPIKLPDATNLIAEKGKALRRAAGRAKTRAATEFKLHGIGRRLWGRTPASKIKAFKVGKLKVEGGEMSVDLTVNGLPGLQETGGRTKPHQIPRGAKGGSYRHPGGALKKYPVIERELDAALAELDRDVERIMKEFL